MDSSLKPGSTPHALVVGGTGMLRGLSLFLAGQGYSVSVIARSADRLDSLAVAAAESTGQIVPLPLDYRQDEQLRRSLEDAIEQHGPISLAVCWIHSTAPEALRQIAEVVAERPTPCRLFHVRGSAVANPGMTARPPEWLTRYPQILYRQVILGFVVDNGVSRWLTNQEISDGVIAATNEDAAYHVVGTVEPWSRRP